MYMINLESRALVGECEVKLYSKDGLLKEFRKVKNITVTSGFAAVCAQMGDPTQPAAFQYCAIGDGTNAPAIGDTLLVSELARGTGGFGITGDTVWTNDCTFAAGVGSGTITESGLFNDAASDTITMLCRQTFGAITKGESDTLVVTWQYTLS